MGAGYDMTLANMKPFMYVESYETCGDIGVIAFGAYNAMGLIGTEKGGVALVLERPHKGVLATKDVPWNPEERKALADRLLKATTLVEVIENAEAEGDFDWRILAEDIKEVLKGV